MFAQHDRRLMWASLVLVLLVAAGLRLYQLSSSPPGFHYDEAVNFIVAREIAFQGARPFPVFAAFNGREVFYYYVSGLAMLGIGQHIFTMHITSAFMNLITVATTIGLGRLLFGKQRGWWIGLTAAAFMTVSFPQIFIARQAFRAVSLPLLQALSLWALYRGLQQRTLNGWLPLAGVLTAAALYTYMASRLFPLWLAAPLLLLLYWDRQHWRQRVGQLMVFGIAFTIAAAPIVNYYLDNQDVFNDRLEQLSGDESAPSYLESAELHARMFFVEGDPYVRYNDPFAPYFSILGGAMLVVGMWAALMHFIDASTHTPLQRSAYLLVLLSPLMVMPSVLALGGLPPSHMRSIGMVPLIFFGPSLGLHWLLGFIPKHVPLSLWQQRAGFVAIGAVFGVLVINVWQRYDTWSTNPDLYYLTDGDMVDAGAWLGTRVDDNTRVYITSLHYDHPSLQIHDLPGENITYLLGERLMLPPNDQHAFVIETTNAPLSSNLQGYIDSNASTHRQSNDHGQPSFTAYAFTATPRARTAPHSGESINGWLRFIDSNTVTASAGDTVWVYSVWQVLQPPPYADLTPLFQLETPQGDVLDRVEPYMLHTNRWIQGETLIEGVMFTVPVGTPPGDYPIRTAWVGRASDQYAARIDSNGSFAGLWTTIGTVTVQRTTSSVSTNALPIPIMTEASFGDIELLGHSAVTSALRPGEILAVDLYWRALVDAPANTPLGLVLSSPNGTGITLFEGMPDDNRYPFAAWIAGEIVVDRQRLRLPIDVPAGVYNVTLKRGEQAVLLGAVTIESVNRTFTRPDNVTPIDVNFNDTVGIVGYSLNTEQVVRGASIELTLHWQSLAATDLPLTVFVHLVDPQGVNQDQHDTQPQQNTYPVALWVPGEIVSDSYQLQLPTAAPTGTYEIRVGLYLQTTGQRLRISDSTQDYWLLSVIEVE